MNMLGESALRVNGVLALGFVMTFLLRRKSAALRHLIWLSAFAVALATPLLMCFGPRLLKPWTIEERGAGTGIVSASAVRMRAEPSRVPRSIPYAELLWGLWAAGALACAVRMRRSVAKARALRASAAPVEIFEGVPVAESESAPVAMTLGIRTPLIVLPIGHGGWSPQLRRTVLLHELAHIRRRDCLWQWLPHTVCALHWFNPLAWVARSQMLCEAERACDDAVVLTGANGPQFARALLDIATSANSTYRMKGPDPMMITVASKLESRIARLLDASANRRPLTRAHAISAIAGALIVLLPLAGLRAQEVAPGATASSGAIAGIVTDPSGARVPGATVNLSGHPVP